MVLLERESSCELWLKGESLQLVQNFEYFRNFFFCDMEEKDGEVSERVAKGREVAGALRRMMREKTMSLQLW